MTYLDLPDIQGNIHRPYGRFGFPFARHLFFSIWDAASGRRFIEAVRPRVTTAEPWDREETDNGRTRVKKPPITLNIGFSYEGLKQLELPTRTLRLLPDEFIDGMQCRAQIVGDVGGSAPETWDPAWRSSHQAAHIWIALNVGAGPDGQPLPKLRQWTNWLLALAKSCGGVTLLEGHGAEGDQPWQDSAALTTQLADGTTVPCAREPFGFTDAISDPVFIGQFGKGAEALAAMGGGKIGPGPFHEDTSWSALETGEFILGLPDEGQELPVATAPARFARNGTFMVWRKLKQDVAGFDAYVDAQAELWMRVTGVADKTEARETIRAKMVGRWSSGIPLMAAPTWAEHQTLYDQYKDCIEISLRKPRDSAEQQRLAQYSRLLTSFRYGDDPEGAKCPFGAHIRRANPRDMLDPYLTATEGTTALVNRRRILRRGATYTDPNGETGTVFIAICASIFRQFEFVQQQWINYGLDFEGGNDTCPLVGSRAQSHKHVIPAGPANATPFIAAQMPQFVTTRGGDYFFIPSLTAIRAIAMGVIDPT
ncbi:hypothetical protein [Phenylobacterium sp.]|uniref:Dyp-type peroxidase n=1 Tax=Phenylobacterium sp. TaxID=1871053 RepID=UPI002DE62826|nr:hypothetical protein [Phenylobacterium sp.]